MTEEAKTPETNAPATTKKSAPKAKKVPLKVRCPALGGSWFETKETDPEKAQEAFREACHGLSLDAVLEVSE